MCIHPQCQMSGDTGGRWCGFKDTCKYKIHYVLDGGGRKNV